MVVEKAEIETEAAENRKLPNGDFRRRFEWRLQFNTERKRYIDGKLLINLEKAEEDKDLPDDQVTMNVIKDVANDIK